jgi:hypothetical protein
MSTKVSKFRLTSDPDHPDFMSTEELLDFLFELIVEDGKLKLTDVDKVKIKIKEKKDRQ